MKYNIDLSKWEKRKYPQRILDDVKAFCEKWEVIEICFLTELVTDSGVEYRLMYKDNPRVAAIEWFR